MIQISGSHKPCPRHLLKPMSVRLRQVSALEAVLVAAAPRPPSNEDSPPAAGLWLGGLRRSFVTSGRGESLHGLHGSGLSALGSRHGPSAYGLRQSSRVESRESKAESRKPKAESREPKAESRKPRAESREPRAESREPRAESREPRAGTDRITVRFR